MRLSSRRFMAFLFLSAALFLLIALSVPAHASTWGDLASEVGGSTLLVPFVAVALTLGSIALHKLAAYLDQKKEASQVARFLDSVSSVADGIAETLRTHPPAPADVLAAVRNAAVAQGVNYLKTTYAGTIIGVGITDEAVATRLANAVAGKLLGAVPEAIALLVPPGPAAASPAWAQTAPGPLLPPLTG